MSSGRDIDPKEWLRQVCRSEGLPIPSANLQLCLELTADEQSSNALLSDHLDAEPSVRWQLLALVNTPAIGSGRRFTSVSDVVGQLGRRRLQPLVWTLTVGDVLRRFDAAPRRVRHMLWQHGLLTGLLTERLWRVAGFDADFSGLAMGVCHDLGHLLLEQPGAALGVVWHEEHDSVPTTPGLLPHTDLGEALLALWNAPEELRAAARDHHQPLLAPTPYQARIAGLRLADVVAEHLERLHVDNPVTLSRDPAWQMCVGLPPWSQFEHLDHELLTHLPDLWLQAEHLASHQM